MNLPSFPNIDIFSAGINALNGVLVARHPSHNRGYAVVGLLIMAFFGGIGGGVTRDVLLNEIPSPIKSPAYLLVCLLMGLLGLAIYRYADSREEQFRTRTLAYFKSFTLPWFAILGAHKALDHGLGIFTAIVVGLIATTSGGVFIDIFSGVTPEIVRPSEHIVTTAVLASTVYTLLAMYERESLRSRNIGGRSCRSLRPPPARARARERLLRKTGGSWRVLSPLGSLGRKEKLWTTCGCALEANWSPVLAGR